MKQTLKIIGNCALAIIAALSIRAGMLTIEDYADRYQYKNKSAEEIQKMIKTPNEAGNYIKRLYGPKSFCLNGARAIACMIADDGYNPEVIMLKQDDYPIHWICAYHENNKVGAEDNGIFGSINHEYDSVDSLVKELGNKEHINLTFEYTKGLLADENYLYAKGLENVLKMLEADKKR